jgi:hypothetical protein
MSDQLRDNADVRRWTPVEDSGGSLQVSTMLALVERMPSLPDKEAVRTWPATGPASVVFV